MYTAGSLRTVAEEISKYWEYRRSDETEVISNQQLNIHFSVETVHERIT
jgi:hypothetical protein